MFYELIWNCENYFYKNNTQNLQKLLSQKIHNFHKNLLLGKFRAMHTVCTVCLAVVYALFVLYYVHMYVTENF